MDYHPNSIASGLASRRKKMTLAVILHIQENLFFNDILYGIQKASDEISDYGISVVIKHCTNFDAKRQLDLINESIQEGVNGIIIVPINSAIIKDKINELYSKNYPIISLTNKIEGTQFLSFVGCNYKVSGKFTAGIANMILNGVGQILLFSPSFQMLGHIERAQCFEETLDMSYPNLHLNRIVELTGNEITDFALVQDNLAEYNQTNLIICPGAYNRNFLQLVKQLASDSHISIICYDYSDELRDGLIENSIQASILQCPREQGYFAVKILFNYLAFNQIPNFNHYIQPQLLIKENLESYNEPNKQSIQLIL